MPSPAAPSSPSESGGLQLSAQDHLRSPQICPKLMVSHVSSGTENLGKSPSVLPADPPVLVSDAQTSPEQPEPLIDSTKPFSFTADPQLLHLCVMDSLMPSPSRQLETATVLPQVSLASQFIDGDPINPISDRDKGATELKKRNPSTEVAWAKPLYSASSSSAIEKVSSLISDLENSSQWPSLTQAHGQQKAKKANKTSYSGIVANKMSSMSSGTDVIGLPTTDCDAQKERFPWAAKMSPGVRNLHRSTIPTYLEDGTPKVLLPDHVLLQGLENQKEYVLGQFTPCSLPPGGLVNAVVNRLWGRKCNIFSRKLGEHSYLFHIPDASTRKWVLSRGVWHVDECIMFVAPWTPSATIELPTISTYPVWVTLKEIPCSLYSIPAVELIASGLGEPMLSDKPRLDPTKMGEAKVLVELELDKPFPQKVAAEDKKGNISMVSVEYAWIPGKCSNCGQLGHKPSRCLKPLVYKQQPPPQAVTSVKDQTDCTTLPTSDLAECCVTGPTAEVSPPLPINKGTTLTKGVGSLPFGWSQVSGVSSPVYNNAVAILAEKSPPLQATTLADCSLISTKEKVQQTSSSKISKEALSINTTPPLVESMSGTAKDFANRSSEESDDLERSIQTEIMSICLDNFNSPHSAIENQNYDVDVVLQATNKYAVLHDSEMEDVGVATTTDDFLVSSQRVLRERPVKSTPTVHERQWTAVSKRNRGRGGRGSYSRKN